MLRGTTGDDGDRACPPGATRRASLGQDPDSRPLLRQSPASIYFVVKEKSPIRMV